MSKHKNKIIAGVIIAIVLAFVFWYGGDAPGLRGWTPEPKEKCQDNRNYNTCYYFVLMFAHLIPPYRRFADKSIL